MLNSVKTLKTNSLKTNSDNAQLQNGNSAEEEIDDRYKRDPHSSFYYRDAFVGEKWKHNGEYFKNSKAVLKSLEEQGSMEITHERRVPDTSRPRNVFGRLGLATLATVASLMPCCMVGMPMACFWQGYQTFQDTKYMPKRLSTSGVATLEKGDFHFKPEGGDRSIHIRSGKTKK